MKMKVQCDVCEKAEATLLCCADEAALCAYCDDKVHAANKLASKHQRIPLLSPAPSHSPKCDICQEKYGYFFCLEDRALLCRQCDVSVHSVNHLVAAHQRFLVTGLKVGLEPLSNISSSSSAATKATSSDVYVNQKSQTLRNATKEAPAVAAPFHQGMQKGAASGGVARRPTTISEYFPDSLPGWRMDELLVLPDLHNDYNFHAEGSSKTDNANFGEFDWTTGSLKSEEAHIADCLAQVPEMPSPPTASGLYWPRRIIHPTEGKYREDFGLSEFNDAHLVPDISLQTYKTVSRG